MDEPEYAQSVIGQFAEEDVVHSATRDENLHICLDTKT